MAWFADDSAAIAEKIAAVRAGAVKKAVGDLLSGLPAGELQVTSLQVTSYKLRKQKVTSYKRWAISSPASPPAMEGRASPFLTL